MKESTVIDYEARIRDALAYLDAHHTQDVSPADLARVACFSLHHFHRVFRGVSGETVMQCVRRLRLEGAALRLRRSDVSVVEVALASGFESHEGFTRAFKEHFGAPPNVWRTQESARVAAKRARSAVAIPEVEIRVVPATGFLHMRHHGSFTEVSDAWQRFITRAMTSGLYRGYEQLIGRYPDDPDITPDGKVRFDVGLVGDPPDVPLPDGLRYETLPQGTWAIARHRGPYTTLTDTYLSLVGGWFPSTGRAIGDGPCIEVYLNSPRDTAQADLLTEVWAPLVG